MPAAEERRRGGARYYRTISLPGGKYMHVAIVCRKGKRGGMTVGGRVKERKAR